MTKRLILNGLVMGGLLIVAAAILKFAEHAALITADMSARGGQVAIGLALAVYANLMPKRMALGRHLTALRAGGWAFVLAGLAYAALWAFAPLSLAWPASIAAVGAALGICLIFTVWACTARTRNPSPR